MDGPCRLMSGTRMDVLATGKLDEGPEVMWTWRRHGPGVGRDT